MLLSSFKLKNKIKIKNFVHKTFPTPSPWGCTINILGCMDHISRASNLINFGLLWEIINHYYVLQFIIYLVIQSETFYFV